MPEFAPNLQQYLQYFLEAHGAVVWLILFGASVVEYVFPPFPGDTVTLAGAVFVTAFDGSFWSVFSAVTLGSVVGSALDFRFGTWLHKRRKKKAAESGDSGTAGTPKNDKVLDRLVARFQRHGAAYLVINRFLPGIRAMFFVAAGLSGMRTGPVLFYATLSAGAWNLAIIAIGMAIGTNWERVEALVHTYTTAVWVILAVIVVGLSVRYVVRRVIHRRDAR